MKRWLCLLLLIAAPTFAANIDVKIQPEETFPWWCEFYEPMDHVVDTYVTVIKGGPDAGKDALVTGIALDGADTSRALWRWTPAGRPNKTTYHVKVVVEDAFGSRFACDGNARVERETGVTP